MLHRPRIHFCVEKKNHLKHRMDGQSRATCRKWWPSPNTSLHGRNIARRPGQQVSFCHCHQTILCTCALCRRVSLVRATPSCRSAPGVGLSLRESPTIVLSIALRAPTAAAVSSGNPLLPRTPATTQGGDDVSCKEGPHCDGFSCKVGFLGDDALRMASFTV